LTIQHDRGKTFFSFPHLARFAADSAALGRKRAGLFFSGPSALFLSHCMTALSPSQSTPPPGRTFRLPGRRLLLPVIFVMVLLSIDENKALELAESGALWAFNLSARADGRRKVHYFRNSIELYNPAAGPGRRTGSLEHVIASVLPSISGQGVGVPTVRGSELAWRWCLSQGTVANLIGNGDLREVGQRSGSESPRISIDSAAQFLARRSL
jgi:hypothetical protein